MDALMDNKKLTCRGCHNYLEPPLQVCSNDYAHLFCGECKGKYDECVICNGKVSDLSGRIEETFLAQKYPCKYHIRGCNTMVALHEKSDHEYECNFKIFKCEYGRFCPKPCEWEGPYSEIQTHFRSQHVKFPFSKTPPLSVKMRIPGGSFSFIQMIKAYNELFWFKYRIDSEKQKVFFVFQLIGTKKQASEFLYELEIISLIDANNAIHFTEKCYSVSENISNIFESEQCAVTSFSKIKNFIVDNRLTFNYNIKKIKKFVKNANLSTNTEEDQKQDKSKKNHNPRHNQRRNRGRKGNSKSRDHSAGSNVSKKGQNEFEIIDFKDFDKHIPPPNIMENKNRSNNFQSVFIDQSSQAVGTLEPPAYQEIDPMNSKTCQKKPNQVNPPNNLQLPGQKAKVNGQEASTTFCGGITETVNSHGRPNNRNQNPINNTTTFTQPLVYENKRVKSTENNQAPLFQASSTSARQSNYSNSNVNHLKNVQHPLYQSKVAIPIGHNQDPLSQGSSTSIRQPNYSNYNLNQPNKVQPPVNQNRPATPIKHNQAPLSQASSTSTRQPNYSNYNLNQPNKVQPPVNQNRPATPTEHNQAPLSQASSASTRQPNYSNYNDNQYPQYRASRERKQKKEDNCTIS
ncbi:putative uncharacterized protein DDB_G0282133 [Chrysoperla carnea]|uniref:putative uncharacterized protein DDB_G0282133 n=1 Tax=Chrysoperla carnea TaxID=189513 RepID=UPI001D06AE8E|nr:putative uncharacterized protein DDB_G0282133 [Chrysoperla carnea]